MPLWSPTSLGKHKELIQQQCTFILDPCTLHTPRALHDALRQANCCPEILSSIEPWVAWQDWSTHNGLVDWGLLKKCENERPNEANEGWGKWVNPLQHEIAKIGPTLIKSRLKREDHEIRGQIQNPHFESPISSSALEIARSNMQKKSRKGLSLLSDLVSDPLDSLSSLSFYFIC